MPSRGQSGVVVYMAWDTNANAYKTGDVANHTIRYVKDGVETTPANSPSEVDSGIIPGAYAIAFTSTEATCNILFVGGNSSTLNVALMPVTLGFENLPVQAPNANNGLITVGSSNGQLTMASGIANVDVNQINGVNVVTSAAMVGVNVFSWTGGAVVAPHTTGVPIVSTDYITGVVTGASGILDSNVRTWQGAQVAPLVTSGLVQASAATTVSGIVTANVTQINSVAVATSSAQFGVNLVTVNGAPATTSGALLGVNVTNWTGQTVASLVTSGLVQTVATTTVSGTVNANVTQIGGVATNTSTAAFGVNVVTWRGSVPSGLSSGGYVSADAGKIAGQLAQLDSNNFLKVDVEDIQGVSVATSTAQIGVNVETWQGATVANLVTSGLVQASAATTVSGIVNANVTQVNSVNVTTSGTFMGVNVTGWMGGTPNVLTAAANVPANAAQIGGQTAALDANNLLKVDLEDIRGTAVATSGAAFGVNVATWMGTAPAALGANGGIPVVGTQIPNSTAGAANGLLIAGTNAATAFSTLTVGGVTTFTSGVQGSITGNLVGNVTGNVNGSVASVTGAVGSVTGAVGSVTGAVGSVTGSVGSIGTGGITAATFAADSLIAATFGSQAFDTRVMTAALENAFADALLDRGNAIESSLTPRQALRAIAAAEAGVTSGGATTTFTIKGAGVATQRIQATVDASGNRQAIVLSL